MTKTDLIAIFGSAAEVARFYGITDAAVSLWADDKPIPELREAQLQLRRPEIFAKPPAPQPRARVG
jgi:hypothetical protein